MLLQYLRKYNSIVFWNLVFRYVSLFSSENFVRCSPFLFDKLCKQNFCYFCLYLFEYLCFRQGLECCLGMIRTKEDI